MTITTTSAFHRTARLGVCFLIGAAALTACGQGESSVAAGPGSATQPSPPRRTCRPSSRTHAAMLAVRAENESERVPKAPAAPYLSQEQAWTEPRCWRCGPRRPPPTPSRGGPRPPPLRPPSTGQRTLTWERPWHGKQRCRDLGARVGRLHRPAVRRREDLSPPLRRRPRALGAVGRRKLSPNRAGRSAVGSRSSSLATPTPGVRRGGDPGSGPPPACRRRGIEWEGASPPSAGSRPGAVAAHGAVDAAFANLDSIEFEHGCRPSTAVTESTCVLPTLRSERRQAEHRS